MLSKESNIINTVRKCSIKHIWHNPLTYIFADVVGCVCPIQYTPCEAVSPVSILGVDWNIVDWYLPLIVRYAPTVVFTIYIDRI